MIIESTLSQREFTQHSLARHFQRPIFYVWAFLSAALTAYAIFTPDLPDLLMLAAWLPFLVYIIAGWIIITRRGRDKSLPIYLPTRYELTARGITISSQKGRSELPWGQLRAWRKVGGIYELALTTGQFLIISQRALSNRQIKPFEDMLKANIKPKPEPGIFDQ